jgi:hypothetical protein
MAKKKVHTKDVGVYLGDKISHFCMFSEFKHDDIHEKHSEFVEHDKVSGAGNNTLYDYVFDVLTATKFALLAYMPDSPTHAISDLRERKQWSLELAEVPKEYWDKILSNENPMIGDMATRILREVNDFDYELIVSAKEAIETLLEVVRKPINTFLQDDKERNAVKAKRECFEDAKFLLAEVRKLINTTNEDNPDVASHLTKSVFKSGMSEKLAEKTRKD